MVTAAIPPFSVQQRPPLYRPELNFRGGISFLHPRYERFNLLCTFPRVDSILIADATPIYRIYHRTSLLASQILAANAVNNIPFTIDRAGQQPAYQPRDGILQ